MRLTLNPRDKLYQAYDRKIQFIRYLKAEALRPGSELEDPKLALLRSFSNRRKPRNHNV